MGNWLFFKPITFFILLFINFIMYCKQSFIFYNLHMIKSYMNQDINQDINQDKKSHKNTFTYAISLIVVFVISLSLSSCNNPKKSQDNGKLFGDLEVSLATITGQTEQKTAQKVETSTHPILWAASLETLHNASFSIIDAVGGIIQTEWIITKAFANNRYKIIVKVGEELSSQSLELDVIHQVKVANTWTNIASAKNLRQKLRARILDQARILLISSQYD